MGIGIWKTKYKLIYDSLSQDEFDFIDENIPLSDDGTYDLNKDCLAELRNKYSDMNELSGLIRTLDKYVKSGKGNLCFRIF